MAGEKGCWSFSQVGAWREGLSSCYSGELSARGGAGPFLTSDRGFRREVLVIGLSARAAYFSRNFAGLRTGEKGCWSFSQVGGWQEGLMPC